MGPPFPPAATSAVTSTLSATSLTFGSGVTSQVVTYTNSSSTTVQFIQAAMSSGKFGQSNNCDAVAPGASCSATVTYYASNTGSDTGTFTVTSNAPNSPHVVTLAANGASTPTPPPPTTVSGVTLSATSLAFNTSNVTRTVTYTNNTSSTVQFIRASMSSGKFGQSNNCDAVAPGASCTATVTYYPGGSGGQSGTFTVTSTAPNSPHVVSLKGSNSKPLIVGG